jgi:fatty acid desaturase
MERIASPPDPSLRARNPRGDDVKRIRTIQAVIVAEGERLEAKYPILRHRDALGAASCLASCAGMIAMGALYVRGAVPWWATILVSGFLAGILNEVEHDLMHFLYFKDRPWAQNALMVLVWAFRGNYMNPWNRRKIHLHHHKTSGSIVDVETRMTGLGMSWSLLRILLMIDTLWVLGISKTLNREAKGFYDSGETMKNMIPFTWIFFSIWVSLLGFQAFHAINAALHLGVVLTGSLAAWDAFLSIAWVVYIAPSMLRTAALHIISSNTHYSGPNLDLLRQTQSQGAWFLWPLQPFCFNFGKTHCIHHLVVQQPFFLRQMVASVAYKVMREHGILFNDYGTFLRRNAYPGNAGTA